MSLDVLDRVLGVTPGDRLDVIWRARAATKSNAQRSYDSLFRPVVPNGVSVAERLAVAVVVSRWHGGTPLSEHYETEFAAAEPSAHLIGALREIAAAGATAGPYGVYREHGLAAESTTGLRFTVPDDARAAIGDELSTLLEHVHLLVFRPREASAEALQALLDQGWTTTDLVCVSQLVAFLTFQIRYANGLSVLRDAKELR